jgi:uncharacterized NAD-dependent epimerase/dehydratase family protein
MDGVAIVYCQGAFLTANGKTAHGLVRFTKRYKVAAVIDATVSGDAGTVLDGKERGIPLVKDVATAIAAAKAKGLTPTHFVMGLAPDGGRLPPSAKEDVKRAIEAGLNVDSGLHDFLSEDPQIAALAEKHHVRIRDVRRPPPRDELHSFTGAIEDVRSFRVAMLGTDSAVGKRTTSWMLVHEFERRKIDAEMIGTGQTAWMQGVKFGIVLDSIVNDFLAGELENAVVRCWKEERPDVMVVEGQGSLMNPAYPGGYEILAATRPHAVVVQHAPTRKDYDGFPGYPIHPLERQIQALEVVSDRKVAAITVNTERLQPSEVDAVTAEIERETGLVTVAPLFHGVGRVVDRLDEMRRAK